MNKIDKIPLVLSVLLAITLICGCKNEEEKWKEANDSNNVTDYINFVLKYPNSIYAAEARSYLRDTISKMHIEAMDAYRNEQYSEKQQKESALKIYKRILQIDPNDAHALNNAAVLTWMSYEEPGKKKLQQVKDLFDRSYESSNRRRISSSSLGWVTEGNVVYLALPPTDEYERFPLKNLVFDNITAIYNILDIPPKEPVSPPELIISGTVVDGNDLPVANRRVWLIGIVGEVDFNNINYTINFNDEGKLTTPHADTDEKGQFSLLVAYDNQVLDNLPTNFFFVTTLPYENIITSKNSLVLTRDGETLAIYIDENTNVVDIGKTRLGAD